MMWGLDDLVLLSTHNFFGYEIREIIVKCSFLESCFCGGIRLMDRTVLISIIMPID